MHRLIEEMGISLLALGLHELHNIAGENGHHQVLQDIILHLAQLPGQLPRGAEEAEDVPALAGRDHLVGPGHGVLEVLQRFAHRPVHRRHSTLLLQKRQQLADPAHAPLDPAALLLVLADRLHRLLDRERQVDDLVNDEGWISHPAPCTTQLSPIVRTY